MKQTINKQTYKNTTTTTNNNNTLQEGQATETKL
jgi:hypothetical protein